MSRRAKLLEGAIGNLVSLSEKDTWRALASPGIVGLSHNSGTPQKKAVCF